jgi:hypothetical protein
VSSGFNTANSQKPTWEHVRNLLAVYAHLVQWYHRLDEIIIKGIPLIGGNLGNGFLGRRNACGKETEVIFSYDII